MELHVKTKPNHKYGVSEERLGIGRQNMGENKIVEYLFFGLSQ